MMNSNDNNLKKKKYFCSFPGCGKSFTDSSNRKVKCYYFIIILRIF